MPIGERECTIKDADGETVGSLVVPGLYGLTAPELRHWRILYNREGYEREKYGS